MSFNVGGRHAGENASYESRATVGEVAALLFSCDTRDAARILGVSATQVQRLAMAGRLPGRKVGNQWRFSTRRLVELIDGGSW